MSVSLVAIPFLGDFGPLDFFLPFKVDGAVGADGGVGGESSRQLPL